MHPYFLCCKRIIQHFNSRAALSLLKTKKGRHKISIALLDRNPVPSLKRKISDRRHEEGWGYPCPFLLKKCKRRGSGGKHYQLI